MRHTHSIKIIRGVYYWYTPPFDKEKYLKAMEVLIETMRQKDNGTPTNDTGLDRV